MFATKTRTTIAAAAVAAALLLAGSTGVAAAGVKGSAAMSGSQTTQTTASSGTTSVALTAGSTGQGPATQADCDRYADAINSWGHATDTATNYDDMINAINNTVALEDKAMDDGCFLVY